MYLYLMDPIGNNDVTDSILTYLGCLFFFLQIFEESSPFPIYDNLLSLQLYTIQ